jgi:hypothetical protein
MKGKVRSNKLFRTSLRQSSSRFILPLTAGVKD